MQLQPVVEVRLPGFLKWSRHKLDIKSTSDIDRWWGRVSSSELRQNGVTQVVQEQDRLLSFKVAHALKSKTHGEMEGELTTLFSLFRKLDVEAPVGEL